jgi:uncharacterized membrane protein
VKRWVPLCLIFILLWLGFSSVQSAIAKDGTAYTVLFYSPTCSHCANLEAEFLPKLQNQYGKKLVIVRVNVISAAGSDIYEEALRRFNVPENRIRVPAMIIGEEFLVGTVEIPDKLPGFISEALSKGGVDWPEIKGLREEFFSQKNVHIENLSIWQYMTFKFKQDPLANGISAMALFIMFISLIAAVVITFTSVHAPNILKALPLWIIPPLVVVGLVLAGYLSVVEVSEMYADCGPVGNCNAVQNSPYAKLFGILPIAILGIVGYVAILAAWLFQKFGPMSLNRKARLILWGLAIFGVLFSSYLTFLEPFVIGATCVFCLISAMVLTIILWASILPTKKALHNLRKAQKP